MSRLLLCIDDTDDLSKQISTGSIAELIAEMMDAFGIQIPDGVTRHQLLLSREIAYTSHNSSMCVVGVGEKEPFEKAKKRAEELLIQYAVDTANPGMAVCVWEQLSQEQIRRLIRFGKTAKRQVLSLDEAERTAKECGVYLKAFGGNGAGRIGALAGIGLRLSGNDGTFRGKVSWKFSKTICSCREVKEQMHLPEIYRMDGKALADHEQIRLKKQMKFALLDHKKALVVKPAEDTLWEVCEHADLYEKTKDAGEVCSCVFFLKDNDLEEQLDQESGCWNCLYRRWTKLGMECVRNKK